MLQVGAESFIEVIFPIVAIIDKGKIDLKVSAITQIGRDEETATLKVEVSGVANTPGTSDRCGDSYSSESCQNSS